MDTASPRRRDRAAHAICFLAFALVAGITGCTHSDIRGTSAVEHMLDACRLLSPDGPEVNLVASEEEVWFWFQDERARASRKLWNRGGIDAHEAH